MKWLFYCMIASPQPPDKSGQSLPQEGGANMRNETIPPSLLGEEG